MSTPLARFLARLDGVKRRGSGWVARCPAHEDRSPSLSVAEGSDGQVLACCFTGCAIEAITAAVNISVRDLYPERRGLPRSRYAERRRPWQA